MGGRAGGGASGGMGRGSRTGAGGFTGPTAQVFGHRIGTTGTFQALGQNGRRTFSGGKEYSLYVEGNKGSSTLTFSSAAEGNKIINQLSKNGFSFAKGFEGLTFNG